MAWYAWSFVWKFESFMCEVAGQIGEQAGEQAPAPLLERPAFSTRAFPSRQQRHHDHSVYPPPHPPTIARRDCDCAGAHVLYLLAM